MIHVLIRPEFESQLEARLVETTAQFVLEHEAIPPETSLSVVITDDEEIRSLNRQFLGIDAPTDVLAFGQDPTTDPVVPDPDEEPYLGDVLLSFVQAQMQAAEQQHGTIVEIRLLIVHGILHLLGYDHDTPEARASMWALQDAILTKLEESR